MIGFLMNIKISWVKAHPEFVILPTLTFVSVYYQGEFIYKIHQPLPNQFTCWEGIEDLVHNNHYYL